MHGRRVLYFKLHVQCARAHKTLSRPQVVHPCSSPKKFYLGNWGYACMTSTQLKAFLQLIWVLRIEMCLRPACFKPVVLKREPLVSLREEFWIPGRKFVPGRKSCGWKNLSFYYHFIQHIKKQSGNVGLDGNVYSTQAQAASPSSSSFETVLSIHGLATLGLGAGVERPIDCVMIQNGQAVQSTGRLVDRLDIGRQHGQQFDLLRHTHNPQKRSYPFIQTGEETSATGVVAVRPRCP